MALSLPPLQPGRPVEQLGPGETEDQDRGVPAPVGDVLDELEERGLAPVEIVQEDDQRPLGRPRLEQPADAERDFVGRRLTVAEQGLDGGIVRRLGAEELLDDLDRGPVGDPLAVGQAASADDRCVDVGEELLREARLADARRPEDREQGARPLRSHAFPGAGEQLRLAAPAHERCVEPPDVRHFAGDRNEPVCGQRLRLSFRLERREQLHLDRVPHEPVGIRAQQHLTDPGRLLESRRDVDRVARDERVGRARDDLASVDADPYVDLDRVAELQRRSHGTERIVLVHLRHTEDRHHGVADELLDRAAVTLDRGSRRLEVPRHRGARRFRVEPLRARGRADHVAEEHGHRLPLLARQLGLGEYGATGVTEAGALPVLGSAARAGGHAAEPSECALSAPATAPLRSVFRRSPSATSRPSSPRTARPARIVASSRSPRAASETVSSRAPGRPGGSGRARPGRARGPDRSRRPPGSLRSS